MHTSPGRRNDARAESITRARTGLTRDLRGRQRRYLAAMLVRSGCVVVMAVTWNCWPALAVCALAGAGVIPCVAVVVAQAGWPQRRGARPALARVNEEPATRVVLEPTPILPQDRNTAG